MSGRIQRGLLWAQRLPWRPPAVIRNAVRSVLGDRLGGGVAIPDWSTPLIDRGQDFSPLERFLSVRPTEPTPAAPSVASTGGNDGGRLRCAFVIDGLWPGGVSEFVMLLATRLPALGIDTCIVDCDAKAVTHPHGRYHDQAHAAGVPIFDGSTRSAAHDAFVTWKPDVVCEQGLTDAESLEAAHALNLPIVEVLHGMHSYLDGWSDVYRRASDRTTLFVAVSELVRQQYLDIDPDATPDRVVTIPNALDKVAGTAIDRDAARRNLGLDDEFLFVCLGRYCLQKNMVGTVDAFAAAAEEMPDAHLLIAGHAVDPFHYAQTARQRDLAAAADRIHLRGETGAPDVLLAAADAFVLDSFFEGWSLAVMEAIYAGLPIVVAEMAGAAEQVGADGERGVMVPNPVGHPGLVGWEEIRRVAYGDQANTAEMRTGLIGVYRDRSEWQRRRNDLRSAAPAEFPVEAFLSAHAEVLRHAVVVHDGTG